MDVAGSYDPSALPPNRMLSRHAWPFCLTGRSSCDSATRVGTRRTGFRLSGARQQFPAERSLQPTRAPCGAALQRLLRQPRVSWAVASHLWTTRTADAIAAGCSITTGSASQRWRFTCARLRNARYEHGVNVCVAHWHNQFMRHITGAPMIRCTRSLPPHAHRRPLHEESDLPPLARAKFSGSGQSRQPTSSWSLTPFAFVDSGLLISREIAAVCSRPRAGPARGGRRRSPVGDLGSAIACRPNRRSPSRRCSHC